MEALWRWRDGVSIAVEARRGGKVSEDIVVPLDRLAEAIEETVAIGARQGWRPAAGATPATATCTRHSWSRPATAGELERRASAAEELFELAVGWGDRSRASTGSAG